MKVITKTTIRTGKGKATKYLSPGNHDLPPDIAKELVESGNATLVTADPEDGDKKLDDKKLDDKKPNDPPKT